MENRLTRGKAAGLSSKTKSLAIHAELKLYLPQILPKLPPQLQSTLKLRLEQELSIEELSEALGCSDSTAKVYLKKALLRGNVILAKIKEKENAET